MNLQYLTLITCHAILYSLSIPVSYADDSEIRSTITVDKRHFHWSLSADLRYQSTTIRYKHYDTNLVLPLPQLSKRVTTTWGYRYIKQFDSGNQDWRSEQRFYGQIAKGWLFDKGRLTIRTRQEIRTFANRRTASRNRLRVQWQQTSNNRRFKPFISNEWFYDVDHGTFTRSRWDVGLNLPTYGRLSTKIFYKIVVNRNREFDRRRPSIGLHLKMQ